ncbi:MAG: DUF4105 domain-containing protein [Treponema sp.]|jgi:hypothetical protein|nr:DUF4105 domain-containing protein [Treponema sp.]
MAFRIKAGVLGALLLFNVLGLWGQSGRRAVDDLVFKVAVFGPADDIFIWWGHAALIVENTRWNYSRVFDWGIFSYPSDDFLGDFLNNLVRYNSSVENLDFQFYIDEDRDITVYTLNLEAEGKERILAYAEENVLPENRYYNYHEFRDNCSTRIRDLIDMGTAGQFKEWASTTGGRLPIRHHVRRFTWSRPVWDWFFDLLIGRDRDVQVSLWDEMFLPVEVARNISAFSYTDSSGAERRLVSSIQIINASRERTPVLNAPLQRWPDALLAGLVPAALGALVLVLRTRKPRAGRIAWGIFQSLVGLVLGLLGCVLVYAQFFMKNDYVQQNLNLLFMNPLPLAALPLGILSAAGRTRLKPDLCLRILWVYVAGAGVLTRLIGLLPTFSQRNLSVLALILPLALLLSLGAGRPPRSAATGGGVVDEKSGKGAEARAEAAS